MYICKRTKRRFVSRKAYTVWLQREQRKRFQCTEREYPVSERPTVGVGPTRFEPKRKRVTVDRFHPDK